MSRYFFLLLVAILGACSGTNTSKKSRVVLIEPAVVNDKLSAKWLDALVSRMSRREIDSFAAIKRPLTEHEQGWKKLFQSRTERWESFRDSLGVPFEGITLKDTIFVLNGFSGKDDAFTHQENNICFDLTAFANVYGEAIGQENESRADRIFCHEYTHLLHKSWAKKNQLALASFRDSVLWECLYEGIGMYRSFNEKLISKNGELTVLADSVKTELYPQFVEHISFIEKNTSPTETERKKVRRNLSRGPVRKKWGATNVGIWLAQEAKGNDKNLVTLINKGPETVLTLAMKYLDPENRMKLIKARGQ